jgi:mannose-6-phosphate isomerase-like protein (cupin superfamily)
MEIVENAGTYAPAPDGAPSFVEQLRVAALSVGTYSIPAGGVDAQSPHREDEIYVVTAGAAVMEAGGERAAVRPGAVIYVPAREPHRFVEISEDFATLVFFAPPYTEPDDE